MYQRDTRLWAVGIAFLFLPLIYVGVFLAEGTDRLTALAIGLCGVPLMYAGFKHILHGAIVLHRGKRQVQLFRDFNFQTPAVTVPASRIAQVELRSIIHREHRSGMHYFLLVLVLNDGTEQPLDLKFFDESAGTAAAQEIGAFADASQ